MNEIINYLGWIGGIMFALCALPQVIQCFKQKHAEGVSLIFLLLWLFGEIFTLIYVLFNHGLDLPLIVNYILNIIFIVIIIYYKNKR